MDYLITLDKQWLLLINSMNSQFGDVFFYIFTQTITWIPLYVLMAWAFFKHQGAKGIVSLLFIALVITICDQIASSVFKELFERYRPSHDPVLKNLVHLVAGKRGGLYGFFFIPRSQLLWLGILYHFDFQEQPLHSSHINMGHTKFILQDLFGAPLPWRHIGRFYLRIGGGIIDVPAIFVGVTPICSYLLLQQAHPENGHCTFF